MNNFPLRRRGFTLIELLVVISIIGILAALMIPVAGKLRQNAAISRVQAELQRAETAIEAYKARLGFYPPDNTLNPAVNPLFFELMGVRLAVADSGRQYQALNSAGAIAENEVAAFFGNSALDGFANVLAVGGEDGLTARNFWPDIAPGQYLRVQHNDRAGAVLGTLVNGPVMLQEIPGGTGFINPFRYNSSNPVNNPSSFDLWVDIRLGGKTNRISNWSERPIPL